MTTPSIQNDFSYYRRIVSRHSLSGSISDEQDLFKTTESDEQISSALASHMSLFYAQPTPMLKVLSEATMKFVADVSFYLKNKCLFIYLLLTVRIKISPWKTQRKR